MGSKLNPGKYDCADRAKPDEPVFTLLGRDPNAGAAIRAWAASREMSIRNGQFPLEDMHKVWEAKTAADEVDRFARGRGANLRTDATNGPVAPVKAHAKASADGAPPSRGDES